MDYRILGATGLKVSAIALGTVELGMDYGITTPGGTNRPDKAEAISILRHAADAGINLFDIAPEYGESEKLAGEALGTRRDCFFATKVSIPRQNGKILTCKALQSAIDASLDRSLKATGRDCLDIVQIHSAPTEVIRQGEITGILLKAKHAGKVRFIGVSVYGVEAAAAAINDGRLDVVQVAYNIFDQQMTANILPAARQAGIGVISRSALLKGALTERAKWLPAAMAPLREQARRAVDILTGSWEKLPQVALRFCLSSPDIHTVLFGVSNSGELETALQAAASGPLTPLELKLAAGLKLTDEHLTNPVYWPIP